MLKKAALAVAVSSGLLAAAPAVAQTVLKASSWVPPSHILTEKVLLGWGAQVEKATNGKVKLEVLPKAVANPPGHWDAVRDGLADVTFNVHGYVPGRFTLTKVAEFPFIGDSSEAISVAYQRVYEKYLAKANEHKGLKVLCVFTHGPGVIYNTKRPIKELADLSGLKFRVGGGMVNDVGKAIGANVLLKPAPESYELVSTGVVDGVFFPAESVVAFKLEKFIKYATVIPGGLYNTSFALYMNEDKWRSLSKQDQAAIDSVSGENCARLAGRAWDDVDRRGKAIMQANNIQVLDADAKLVADVKSRTAGLEKQFFADAKAKGVDGEKALAELRAEIRKLQGAK